MKVIDHGIPLASMKEYRRKLVLAIAAAPGLPSSESLNELASVQQCITAFEAVIAELDAE